MIAGLVEFFVYLFGRQLLIALVVATTVGFWLSVQVGRCLGERGR